MNIEINFLVTIHCSDEILGLASTKQAVIDMVTDHRREFDLDKGDGFQCLLTHFLEAGGLNGHKGETFLPLINPSECEGHQKTAIKITTLVVTK